MKLPLLLAFAAALTATQVLAQAESPVQWTYALTTTPEGAVVRAHAEIAPGWHVYGMFLEEGGPIATELQIDPAAGLRLAGEPTESGDATHGHDPIFDMELVKFKGSADFAQALLLAPEVTAVSGAVTFMACTTKQCLPPNTLPFSLRRSAN